jgi:hypothetical protein
LWARDDSGDIRVAAVLEGSRRPALFGFQPPSVLFLPSILPGLFLGTFLNARPRILPHDFTPASVSRDGPVFADHTYQARASFRVLVVRRPAEPESDFIHALIVLGIVRAFRKELAPAAFRDGSLGAPLSLCAASLWLAFSARRRIRTKIPWRLIRSPWPICRPRAAGPARTGKRIRPRTGALLPGTRFVHHEWPPFEHLLVKPADSLLRLGDIAPLDEGKSSRFSGLPVRGHPHGKRGPEYREKLLQLGFRHIVWQVSHEEPN